MSQIALFPDDIIASVEQDYWQRTPVSHDEWHEFICDFVKSIPKHIPGDKNTSLIGMLASNFFMPEWPRRPMAVITFKRGGSRWSHLWAGHLSLPTDEKGVAEVYKHRHTGELWAPQFQGALPAGIKRYQGWAWEWYGTHLINLPDFPIRWEPEGEAQ
jgi:hypothetical protein